MIDNEGRSCTVKVDIRGRTSHHREKGATGHSESSVFQFSSAPARAAAGRQAVSEFRPFRPANFGRIDWPARPRALKFPGRQADRPIGLSHKLYRQRHVLNYEIMQCGV